MARYGAGAEKLRPFIEAFPPDALRAWAEGLGQETFAGSSGRIFLVARDTRLFPNAAADAQLKSFLAKIRSSGAKVAVTNLLKLDPLRITSVPGSDYLQLLQRTAEADVVVSFLGPPNLGADQLTRLGEKRPKIIAVCSGAMPSQINLKQVAAQKLLHVAIISKQDVTAPAPAADTTQSWFDHLYVVVPADKLSDLPGEPARR